MTPQKWQKMQTQVQRAAYDGGARDRHRAEQRLVRRMSRAIGHAPRTGDPLRDAFAVVKELLRA